MRPVNKQHGLAVGLLLLLHSLSLGAAPEAGLTAGQLIEQAHRHDNMWASDQDADQKKALEYYEAALAAQPDEQQKLHILYRMAQLYGSAYQLEKGERPDFRKAIELNRRIVESYPPTESLVFKALISLGDHHISLWQFGQALQYFERVLEYDVDELEASGQGREDEEARRQRGENIARIKEFQKIAVDQVAYCSNLINPLCVNGALQHIAATHPQAFIREYAAKKMASGKDPFTELWAPSSLGENPALSVETRRSVQAGQPLPQGKDGPASPPRPLTVPPGGLSLGRKLLLGVMAGLAAVGVLCVVPIVVTRKHHCTLIGKDVP
jgi:tetratricopeptide (TPR) repeat protein